ncbi:hypothetical protein [Amycolatopsis acidicola]|uniref:hypothetical protein n=1 Tax=Amycolatopsis acidicola TaxID=2596893 RepID=UPI001FB651CF|nr:hypothetical protein [Amycolatopsis acidicola]
MSGLATLITAIALFYILFKIPFWFLSATKIGHGRSFLVGLAKAFVAAKTFGMVAGKSGGLGRAGVAAGGSRGAGSRGSTAAADPPWPAQPRIAPTPEAVNKRLQAAYDADRVRAARHPRTPSQRPMFLQPSPQETTHDPAITPAAQEGSAVPEFSSAPTLAKPGRPPTGRRRQAAVAPRFQAPGGPKRVGRAASPARPIRMAPVPPRLRFQAPTPESPHASRPIKPGTRPAATPAFRTAQPEPRIGDARPRTPSVPPVAFRAPKPAPPAVPKSLPRGGEKR